jgi:hypothetical protein
VEALEDRTVPAAISPVGLFAVGADASGGPRVRVFDGSGNPQADFFAYDPNFTGGVRVAVGDFNGDGVPDIVTAPGAGGGPHVKVFDGNTGAVIQEFFAYDANFTGGVFVAVGDVNGDGTPDIITGAGAGGGPHVKVFSGKDGSELMSFFAYDAGFTGGVTVAAGDINGDGKADIVTGAGPGGGPHVKAFSGADGTELMSFFAYDTSFSGGITVAAGDTNGDGKADIVTGAGPGGGPHVRVFDGATAALVNEFFAYEATFTGGVRVGVVDANGDGKADLVFGPGPGGGPRARVVSADGATASADLFAFDPGFLGGITVGGQAAAVPVFGDYSVMRQAIGADRLGKPLGRPEQPSGLGIEVQEFDNGALVGTVGQPLVAVLGDIHARWESLGGVNSPVGFPVSDAVRANQTVFQDFSNGFMVSDPTQGVLSVQGGSTASLPLLVSDAAMFEGGQSVSSPGLGLSLWVPVVDDVVNFINDPAKALTPEVDYKDLRTGPPGGGEAPLPTPPEVPSPFHYDPTLVKVPPTSVKLHRDVSDIYTSGTVIEQQLYSSTKPKAYWGDQTTANDGWSQVQQRLKGLVGGRDAILLDPLFGHPVKFVLVDQIYDTKTGKPLSGNIVGLNSFSYTTSSDPSRDHAARIIQIKKWNDATGEEEAIRTMVHEVGHTWILQA